MKINFFIIKELSDSTSKHGSLVIINGVGVMIIGKSGIGKSEALLELIEKGHSFVSDDTVILKKIGNNILGYPSPITKDFVESRGLGLIDIPLIYGLKSVKEYTNVNLVIELISMEDSNRINRLGDKKLFYEIFYEKIPKIQIPVGNGRTLSVLIEAATNVYLIKQKGYNSLNIIDERSKK
jgi:HPr kinase/phosphorylase